MIRAAYAADLTDDVLETVTDRPGLTLAKIAKRLHADAGVVRSVLTVLVRDHYVALTREGGRDGYTRA
jgi:DNA-binding IclR family transcriptional regulator